MGRVGLRRARGRRGFTTIELVVALVVGLIVILGLYETLLSQWRLYTLQRAVEDTRETLRGASTILQWDLMGASATGGDLYAVGPQSVALRSVQAAGIVCATKRVGPRDRFGLHDLTGYVEATADDSALVYSTANGSWGVVKVDRSWNQRQAWDPAPAGGGIPNCAWAASSTGPRPQAVVELRGDAGVLAGLDVGAGVRVFRRVEYRLFTQDGRWWLGRRVGSQTAYEILAGPLLPARESGLLLRYYDAAGNSTSDPRRVARVEITLRAESFARTGSRRGPVVESLATTVAIRNNATP